MELSEAGRVDAELTDHDEPAAPQLFKGDEVLAFAFERTGCAQPGSWRLRLPLKEVVSDFDAIWPRGAGHHACRAGCIGARVLLQERPRRL